MWQLTSANAITRLGDLNFAGTHFTNADLAQSITLFVVPAAVSVGPASNPAQTDGATNVAVNTSLNWQGGTNANLHRVYFGSSSNAVANAATNAPEFKGEFATASLAPVVLAASGRFYWRVDEVAGASVITGPVWTFATAVGGAATFPLSCGLGTSDSFVLKFPSQVGQNYRVERSDRLSPPSWWSVADNVPGTGELIQITDIGVSQQSQRFYRVRLLSP